MNPKENYCKVPLIWCIPGKNSEPLDIYLGEAIVIQRLGEEVNRVVDSVPRPYAFVKRLSSCSKKRC